MIESMVIMPASAPPSRRQTTNPSAVGWLNLAR
jgi:hypothetical protein